MTTLVGIIAGKGKKGVVLGSDVSRTQTSWSPQGDVAYRQQRRLEGQKIYVDSKRTLALCMTGVYDQPYVDFLSAVIEGDVDVKQIVEQGFFPELRDLNLARWQGTLPNNDMTCLLIATRFDEPRLYTCWPLGLVQARPYTSIGSGSEYALQYINEQGKLIPRGIDLNEGVDLTVASLDRASQDVYTGGLDLVIVNSRGIYDCGKQIKDDVDRARKQSISRLKRKFP